MTPLNRKPFLLFFVIISVGIYLIYNKSYFEPENNKNKFKIDLAPKNCHLNLKISGDISSKTRKYIINYLEIYKNLKTNLRDYENSRYAGELFSFFNSKGEKELEFYYFLNLPVKKEFIHSSRISAENTEYYSIIKLVEPISLCQADSGDNKY